MPNAESIVIEAGGMRFDAFVEGPQSGELVLLLHGFPQFADMWLPLMHQLSAVGFRCAAVTQRGYSPGARPVAENEYAVEKLVSDVQGFADVLGADHFHLVGHDWGALLAWIFAARFPERLRSLTSLSTPHPTAFANAIENDTAQKMKSAYIPLFRAPFHAAEKLFETSDYALLRRSYQGKVPEEQINDNVRRLSQPGALTAALNWYRALDMKADSQIGNIAVPTLYIWGSDDLALGRTAALDTANYVTGSYQFHELEGRSHWLLEEVPDTVETLVEHHLRANSAR